MRLIDADTLGVLTVIGGRTNGKVECAKAIEEAIRDAPTIDAVPVIRCKDCKYWSGDDDDTFCSELGIFGTDPNSFCSYAKRKAK